MISVLMVCCEKDNEIYLREALESLSIQSMPAEDVLIVLNGPIPGAVSSVIESFTDRLNIFTKRLDLNQGLAAALNVGLDLCKNDIIVRMDPDDICYPNRFQTQYLDMLASDPDVICGSADIINLHGDLVGERILSGDLQLKNFKVTSPIIHPSVMFKRSSVLAVGGYDEKMIKSQDWDLWIKILKNKGKIMCSSNKVMAFRFTESTIAKRKAEQIFNRAILRRHFEFGPGMLFSYARSLGVQYMPIIIIKILLILFRGFKNE